MSPEDNNFVEDALSVAEARMTEAEDDDEPKQVPEEKTQDDPPGSDSGDTEGGEEPAPLAAKETDEAPEQGTQDKDSGKATTEAPEELEQVTTEAEAPIEAPQFWPPEMKALFAKADQGLQKAFLAHEEQRNNWANEQAQKSKSGRETEKRMNEMFAPYADALAVHGVKDPFEATERLLAWDKLFREDPVTGILDLMRKNGISPEHLFSDAEGDDYYEEDEEYESEAVSQLRAELEELKGAREKEAEDRAKATLYQEVEAFKAGTDSRGQARGQFAEMYAPQINQAFMAIQEMNQGMDLGQALEQAYEYVLGRVSQMHGLSTNGAAQPSPEAQARAEEEDARAAEAASSVQGSASLEVEGKKPKAKSIDEAIDRAEAALGINY